MVFVLAIIVGLFFTILIWKTTLGFDLKNNWSNPQLQNLVE